MITAQFRHNMLWIIWYRFQMQSEIKTVMGVSQVHLKHESSDESKKKIEKLAMC